MTQLYITCLNCIRSSSKNTDRRGNNVFHCSAYMARFIDETKKNEDRAKHCKDYFMDVR